LKAKVPDLTVWAKKNDGVFPAERVRKTITGEDEIASHGSREMPIGGPIFHQVEEDVDRGNVRIENLVKSIQVSGPAPTGADLYKQNCAVCHGDDLKGGGSFPYPYRAPDLTTLARRHGGKFPEAYVSDVLRNGVVMPAHGPAEMPIWGEDFRMAEGLSAKQVTQRISELTNYLKSAQVK
jgi:hypothetical protein